MSRPLSAEELLLRELEAAKPRFLSRKKRTKLRQEASREDPSKEGSPAPAGRQQAAPDDAAEAAPEPAHKRRKTPTGTYALSWDSDDDTAGAFQPLVEVDAAHPEADSAAVPGAHWSQKPLLAMTARDWRIFKGEFNITSKGKDIAPPLRRWAEEPLLPARLRDVVEHELRYTEPTPIQRAAVPVALRSRDVVGVAETGSGKTLAFLVPMLAYLLNIEDAYMQHEHAQESNHNRALALVLAPTRELALQIAAEAEKMARVLGLSVVAVIGGHQYEETVHSLRRGVHIVVATPGRLVDSLERGIVSLSRCYHLTMDEADKMIDMGFEKPLRQILLYLPGREQLAGLLDGRIFRVAKRLSLMFTATLSPAIEKITQQYLSLPAYLFVGGAGELVASIRQTFDYLGKAPADRQAEDSGRVARLVRLLQAHRQRGAFSVVVFANYKTVVEHVADALAAAAVGPVAVLHGSKSQEARERAIDAFRARAVLVLVATDVAARGIDVPHVSMVVNYQMSGRFEDYVHRIGRTGRAGREGLSHTFVDDGDGATFAPLRRFLQKGGGRVPEWLLRRDGGG
ncbi:DEAD-domain-containing protein [Metschnikowia bicuspidata var. bicuspidata NRRL YB-4993]|uniref:RNA helicase n=1 Tax=Metschnikowia bicuspidata var. bicuspidata NRRL YB-4993 TaxID=869754 RepID=A0A1A0HFE2_9ASCO|nr:DEAD-domain-containing protein [Metschnikowia bicuspidata var. bicuspidata NRRL YB-4993]OBA22617.1 DEAD-domain-containing protein [Metschnikowia bicuspidata var. bicuspidata NRRL YB-4993]